MENTRYGDLTVDIWQSMDMDTPLPSEKKWRPVLPTGREDVLVEDFPPYLRESLYPWLMRSLLDFRGGISGVKLVAFQTEYREHLGYSAEHNYDWQFDVKDTLDRMKDDDFTNFLSYQVFHGSEYQPESSVHPAEHALSMGGSAWTVSRIDSQDILTRRVPEGVKLPLEQAMSGPDRAAQKLREAWIDAYGVSPRPSEAYSNAVVAVETASLTVMQLGHPKPTLGNVINELETRAKHWKLVFREDPRALGPDSLAKMLRTLWHGHASRHGGENHQDATIEEARGAVVLAATLVQWFTTGVVQRASEPNAD